MRRSTFRLVVALWLITASTLILQWRPVSADRASSAPGTEAARFGLLDAGEYYQCGVNAGDIMCWGWSSWNVPRMYVPTLLTAGGSQFTMDAITDLDVGGTYFDDAAVACIVGDKGGVTGGVWCWGGNYYGQFGNGTNSTAIQDYNEPTRAFGTVTGAKRVAVGQNHVCVIRSDDTVVCTGQNTSGQLGNGTVNDSNVPVVVSTGSGTLSNVTTLSAGLSTTCALVAGDTWCWGNSSNYQVGNFSTSNSTLAVQAYNDPNSTAIEVFGASVCTIGSYGMRCWGENTRAGFSNLTTPRLGTGLSTSSVSSPRPVTAINFIPKAMAMALTHTCALKDNGEVWCFGNNNSGMLGDGTTTNSTTGVQVNLPGPVDVITAGIVSTCAANAAGEMWCWGDGTNGALGNGSSANRSTPVQVTTRMANWTYMGIAPTTTTTLAPTTTTLAPTTTVSVASSGSTVAPSNTTSPGDVQQTQTEADRPTVAGSTKLPATGASTTLLLQWAAFVLLTGLLAAARPRRDVVG